MLKTNVSENGIRIELAGSTLDTCVDVMCLLSCLYDKLEERNNGSEELFYEVISSNLKFIKDKEAFEKEVNKAIKKNKKSANEILGELEDLVKQMRKDFNLEGEDDEK